MVDRVRGPEADRATPASGAAGALRRPAPGRTGKFAAPEVDPELREYLREWRRIAAQEQNVPAYVVMHDASLEELCSKRPRSIAQLLRVSGFGERKAALYGQQILAVLDRFGKGRRAAPLPEKNSRPAAETLRLLQEGRSFEEIAGIRGRQVSTVISAVVSLVETGELEFQSGWVAEERQALIAAACAQHRGGTAAAAEGCLTAGDYVSGVAAGGGSSALGESLRGQGHGLVSLGEYSRRPPLPGGRRPDLRAHKPCFS